MYDARRKENIIIASKTYSELLKYVPRGRYYVRRYYVTLFRHNEICIIIISLHILGIHIVYTRRLESNEKKISGRQLQFMSAVIIRIGI